MKTIFEIKGGADPKARVQALEKAATTLADASGGDAADALQSLLTAAALIASRHSMRPAGECIDTLAHALGCATASVDAWWPVVASTKN